MRAPSSVALVLVAGAVIASSASASQAVVRTPAGTWSGTYSLPRGPVDFSVSFTRSTATVAIDYGHSQSQTVPARTTRRHVRFSLPGRPASVAFDGTLTRSSIAGIVKQGKVRGRFRLRRGGGSIPRALGVYADGLTVVHFADDPIIPHPLLVDLQSGDIHGTASLKDTFTVGKLIGDTGGAGTMRASSAGIDWSGQRHGRVALRQFEVRFPTAGATLAGTFTLPPGPGPFAAAAFVHGSGPRPRGDFQPFVAFLAAHGIASLVYDKRGNGESTGVYPGDRASDQTIDVLAKDAAAADRFLGAQPEVDRARVGLIGDSQAGWIVPLAASREPAVRWALLLVGPTVTVDESDGWGRLAGQGAVAPTGTFAQMEAEIRADGPGGFDPAPFLRALDIPVFWIYGDDDRNVPTSLCVERLQQLRGGHDFSWVVLHTTHTLLDLPSGMNADIPRSRGYAVGLFAAMDAWLRSHSIER